jgi:hypothetical protein
MVRPAEALLKEYNKRVNISARTLNKSLLASSESSSSVPMPAHAVSEEDFVERDASGDEEDSEYTPYAASVSSSSSARSSSSTPSRPGAHYSPASAVHPSPQLLDSSKKRKGQVLEQSPKKKQKLQPEVERPGVAEQFVLAAKQQQLTVAAPHDQSLLPTLDRLLEIEQLTDFKDAFSELGLTSAADLCGISVFDLETILKKIRDPRPIPPFRLTSLVRDLCQQDWWNLPQFEHVHALL